MYRDRDVDLTQELPPGADALTQDLEQERETALFLRPERRENGERTFRLLAGEPLPTSYGPDLYGQIFGVTPSPPRPGRRRTREDLRRDRRSRKSERLSAGPASPVAGRGSARRQ